MNTHVIVRPRNREQGIVSQAILHCSHVPVSVIMCVCVCVFRWKPHQPGRAGGPRRRGVLAVCHEGRDGAVGGWQGQEDRTVGQHLQENRAGDRGSIQYITTTLQCAL